MASSTTLVDMFPRHQRGQESLASEILPTVTWWQTLLVATAPVLLTLVITNWAESRRRKQDAAERQKDREAQAEQRTEARREAVQEAWRTDKMQAHKDLMVFARRLWHCMVEAGKAIDELKRIHTEHGQELTPEVQERLRQINEAFRPIDDVSKDMDALITSVQMFCSEEARAAALRFEHKQMMAMLDIHAILAGNGRKEVDGVSFYDCWHRDLVPIGAFVMIEYASVVRRDLQPLGI